MPWIITTGRPSGRFEPIDDDDDEYPINGFACVAEVRSFRIACPACGAVAEIAARPARPRGFDRKQQTFRCTRCPFKAELRLTVDLGFAHDPERAGDQ